MMSFKNSYDRNSRNLYSGRDKNHSSSYNSIKSLVSKDVTALQRINRAHEIRGGSKYSSIEGFKALNGKTTLNLDPSAVTATSTNPSFRSGEHSSLKSL